MVSRIFPGPTPGESTVIQYQYFRDPLDTDEKLAEAEKKRQTYRDVTYEEDFLTVIDITRRVDVLAEAGDVFRFGRNEMGNQNLHRWVSDLIA